MINQANAFAILPAPKPGEAPIRTDSANAGDDTFRDFMKDAVQDSSTNQRNQSAKQEERTGSTTATESKKPQQKEPRSTDDAASGPVKETSYENDQETARIQQATETATAAETPAALPLTEQLKDLGLSQEKIDALLEFLGIDGNADLNTFLQSLAQQLNLAPETALTDVANNPSGKQQQLLSLLNDQGAKAADPLARAGFTEQESKNLLAKIQTLQSNQAVLQADKTATEDLAAPLSGEKTPETKADFFSQFSDLSKQGEKSEGQTSIDKILSRSASEPAKDPFQKPLEKAIATEPEPHELSPETSIQNNLAQTGAVANNNPAKTAEGFKPPLDVKVESVNSVPNPAAKTGEGAKSAAPETLTAKATSEARIIDQIINKVSLRTSGAQSEIKIKLDPPSLGTVRMNVTTSGDSVRTVIIAENHAVKQIIENNLTQLRDSMNGQGLKIESFTVLVGGNDGQTGQQNTPQGDRAFTPGFGYAGAPGYAEATAETAVPAMARSFYYDSQSISVFA